MSSAIPEPRWIVAQKGSREHYVVPLAWHRLQQLRLFYTDIWCRWGRSLLHRGPEGARALATRFHPGIPPERVVSWNSTAIPATALRHFRRRRAIGAAPAPDALRFGRWFAGRVRRHLATLELDPERDFFFGFNLDSLEALEFLRERRVRTVLDQVDPGQVEEDLVLREAERWEGWEQWRGPRPAEYWERIRAEWEAAAVILVNSEWSRQALVDQGVSPERIIVVPLTLELPPGRWEPVRKSDGPLKVLWLGSVMLRKGIQYLVEAARLLQRDRMEFTVAGPVYLTDQALRTFPPDMRLLGRITRDRLGELYRQAHVFVLPTISDGFALTQLEAMAHGLPVIATPNCGRVVTHGVDGLIVPARDSHALALALARLDQDRALLREMSRQALRTVERFDALHSAALINTLAQDRGTVSEFHGARMFLARAR